MYIYYYFITCVTYIEVIIIYSNLLNTIPRAIAWQLVLSFKHFLVDLEIGINVANNTLYGNTPCIKITENNNEICTAIEGELLIRANNIRLFVSSAFLVILGTNDEQTWLSDRNSADLLEQGSILFQKLRPVLFFICRIVCVFPFPFHYLGSRYQPSITNTTY